MQFAIPLSSRRRAPASQRIVRAQLYNLDENQHFQLQFNPEIDPRLEINWADEPWLSAVQGHTQFLGVAPFEFEIPLHFEVAPGAPPVPNSCSPQLMDGAGLIVIEAVLEVLDRWCKPRQDFGRPPIISFIQQDNSYRGRITSLAQSSEDRFWDGRLRRLTIRLGFRQWRTNNALR